MVSGGPVVTTTILTCARSQIGTWSLTFLISLQVWPGPYHLQSWFNLRVPPNSCPPRQHGEDRYYNSSWLGLHNAGQSFQIDERHCAGTPACFCLPWWHPHRQPLSIRAHAPPPRGLHPPGHAWPDYPQRNMLFWPLFHQVMRWLPRGSGLFHPRSRLSQTSPSPILLRISPTFSHRVCCTPSTPGHPGSSATSPPWLSPWQTCSTCPPIATQPMMPSPIVWSPLSP